MAGGCTYKDCTIQEVSIVSLAGPKRKTKYFYQLTRTEITPVKADGKLDEQKAVAIEHVSPGRVAPEVVKLVAEANAALGASLDDLLNTNAKGTGRSTHAFGCADECDCERKRIKITLPNGKEVDDPGQTLDGGQPKGPRDVPGKDQPLVVIEKRVNIKGKGLFLLTYELHIFGTVRRYAGRCVEKKDEKDDSNEDLGTEKMGMGTPGLVEPIGLWGGLRKRPILLVGIGLSLCCCLALVCAAIYYFFWLEPDDIVIVPTETVEITEEPLEIATATDTSEPTATIEESIIITETVDIPPTFAPEPTLTLEKDFLIFAGYVAAEVLHGTGESEIIIGLLVLGADPEPVEGAEVLLSMQRPDGTLLELAGTSDEEGWVEIVFDIFEFENYIISIVDITADGFEYAPALNLASEFIVEVGPGETKTVPANRVFDFYFGFNEAMRGADADFLFDALHPAVLERYGEAACMARLVEVVQNPIIVSVLGVVDFGVWSYERDERTEDIANAYSVDIALTQSGGTTDGQTVHLALRDDGSIGWFTDCGEPLE